jgi:hypothetical protein
LPLGPDFFSSAIDCEVPRAHRTIATVTIILGFKVFSSFINNIGRFHVASEAGVTVAEIV